MTICRATALLLVLGGLLLPGGTASGVEPSDWAIAEPGYNWSFPEDHWAHPAYKTEWWYFTGHLTVGGETEPRFGYQFTIFRVGLSPELPTTASTWNTRALVMGHASVSDLRTGEHVFSDVLHRTMPLLGGFNAHPDSVIAWCAGPPGTDRRWELRYNGAAFDFTMEDAARGIAFELTTTPAKPMIFQGPDGYSRKGEGASAASLYYSFTRLETLGSLRIGEETLHVSGTSWMDKEIGSNQLDPDQVGWDWFSLQLDDGRELMLYELRNAAGELDFGRGTLVAADGSVRYIGPGDWNVSVTDHWTSPRTGARYPAGWTIDLPGEGLELTVRPLLNAQENLSTRSSGIGYWEGAVEIAGPDGPVGRGYVEMTGYGDLNRPAL